MKATLYHGDALDVLKGLEAGSVHCVVTSPPYWGLRNYEDAEDQLGLEKTPEEYVAKLVAVFREVRRVLRDDGTCWLNLGDSYAGTGKSGGGDQGARWEGAGNADHVGTNGGRWCSPPQGLKPGDLVGIPWRVAFALQADGWWLRKDNIWAKPNPMPESVNGVRWERHRRKAKDVVIEWVRERAVLPSETLTAIRKGERLVPCTGCDTCLPNDLLVLRHGSWRHTSAHEYVFQLAKSPLYFCDAEAVREKDLGADHPRNVLEGQPGLEPSGGVLPKHSGIRKAEGRNGAGRNPRSVWEITTKPFAGSHFATFPPELPERCIRAGTAEKNCGECGAPWAPVVERKRCGRMANGDRAAAEERGVSPTSALRGNGRDAWTESAVLGHRPTCDHDADPAPAVVLDPYVGSGTTGLVALRLNRDFIGIDLAYCDMAAERITDDAPLLNTVELG